MTPYQRIHFDRELEQVLAELPAEVHKLLEEIPLHVDDFPTPEVLAEHGLTRRDELCGRYAGIPLTERSIQHSGQLPDQVTIYRAGLIALARDAEGRVSRSELRRQIRITILHELGHHHGLDEDDLAELGYD